MEPDVADRQPKIIHAGQRETGALCSCCGLEIVSDVSVSICADCGDVHHTSCWEKHDGCSSYQCSEASFSVENQSTVPLSITQDELSSAVPLPTRVDFRSVSGTTPNEQLPRRWNRISVWAFVLALLGIPLFGLITGLFAIVLACVALVLHTENKRGLGLAIAAMLLGLCDVVGWAGFLSMYWGGGTQVAVSLSDLPIDPTSLDNLPAPIARAMRANVMVHVDHGLGRGGMGSGIVLAIQNGSALIVTNRHVIDSNFSETTKNAPADLNSLGKIMVMAFNQVNESAVIEWVAPYGIDLAVLSAPVSRIDVAEAYWNTAKIPRIGDQVFAVGNPHGLGWTHTIGNVSQIRRQSRGVCDFKILQSSAPINPGNSGGGLYDEQGQLIGINTMTADKRVAEGIGFSIALPILIDLIPDRFHLREQNPTDQRHEELAPKDAPLPSSSNP